MNGKGVFKWPNGNVYTGTYCNDIKEGYGEFKWGDQGSKYKGNWLNGLQHGEGVYINTKGREIKG